MDFQVDIDSITRFELEPCTFCKHCTKCPKDYVCDVFMTWNIFWIDMTSDANKEE